MAMLAVLDVDDLATPKIERVKNALDDLSAQTASAAKATSAASKGFVDPKSIDDQLQSLAALSKEMAAIRAQSNAWGILSKQMQEGQRVTKTQADALRDLSGAILDSDKSTHQLRFSSMVLAGGLKEGATVTAEMRQKLIALGQEFDKANGIISKTPQEVDKAKNSFEGLGKSAQLLIGAMAALGAGYKLKGLLEESFQLAARNQVLSTTLQVVSKNAHLASNEMELQAQKVKALGITTRESRESVIQFAQAQLNIADTAKIARVAQDLAVVAGTNSSEAFNRLTRAIQMQQGVMLRSFGIVKGTEQIYNDYAQTIGKTVKTLTDMEKKQAFIHTIMKEGEKVAGAYTNAMNDVGKAMTSLDRLVEEAKTRLGEALLPIMLKVVNALTEILKWLGSLSPEVMKWAAAIGAALVVMTTFLGIVAAVTAALPLLAAAWAVLLGPVGLVALAIGAVTAALVVNTAASGPQIEAANQRQLALKAEVETLEELKTKLGEQRKAYVEAKVASDGSADGQERVNTAAMKYEATLSKISAAYPGVIRGETEIGEKYLENVESIDKLILKLQERRALEQREAVAGGKQAKQDYDTALARATALRDAIYQVEHGGTEGLGKQWAVFAAQIGTVSPAIGEVARMMDMFGATAAQKSILLNLMRKELVGAEEDVKTLGAAFEKFKAILDQLDPSRAGAAAEREVERIAKAAGGMEALVARAAALKVDITPVLTFDRAAYEKGVREKVEVMNRLNAEMASKTGADRDVLLKEYIGVGQELETYIASHNERVREAETKFTTADAEDKKKRTEATQKWQQAYKQAYESITETNATAGASFSGAQAALDKAGLSTEQYASRLLRAKSIVDQWSKASPEMRARFKDLADDAAMLEVIKLDETLDKWQKKFKEVSEAVRETAKDMTEGFARGAQERIEAASRAEVDEAKKRTRTIETLETEMYERLVVAKMTEVDQKLYANEKYYTHFRRGIQDQIDALRRQQEEEARLITKRQVDAERQLDDTIAKAKLRFKIEIDAETAIQKAVAAIKSGKSKEEIEAEITNIKAKFDAEMNLIRDQGMQRIAETTKQEREALRIKKEAQDQHILDLEDMIERSKSAQAQGQQEILRDYDRVFQVVKGLAENTVAAFANGFTEMIAGTKSFKDVFIGIWQSIKNTLLGIFNDIVSNWIRSASKLATSGGGFDIGKFFGGLFGRGGSAVAGGGLVGQNVVPSATTGFSGLQGITPGGGGMFGGHLWGRGLTTGQAAMGGVAGGAIGGAVGFGIGSSTGSKTWGALSGAGTGAAAGAMFGGPLGAGIGAAIGGIAGLIGGWFGGKKQAEEAKRMREELIKSAGGLEELKKRAEEAGFSLDKLLSTKKPKVVEAEIKKLNEALEKQAKIEALKKAKEDLDAVFSKTVAFQKLAQLVGFDVKRLYDAATIEDFNKAQEELNDLLAEQEERLQGLGTAAAGIQSRVAGLTGFLERSVEDWFKDFSDEARTRFEDDFKAAQEAGFTGSEFKFAQEHAEEYGLSLDRLHERQARVQESINRIGEYAMVTFGSILRETGDIGAAFAAIAGPLDEIAALMEETGTEAQGAFRYLMEFRHTVRNNEDVAQSLSGINQILMGLADSGRLTAEMFNMLGTDASEQWRIMEERGVAADQALLLMQPTLQALYEAQKKYGFATDEATQKLIDMGIENGVVGDQFQDVNSKMLDMLVLIAEALGATIPEAYRNQQDAASQAGQVGTDAAEDQREAMEHVAIQTEEARRELANLKDELARLETGDVDTLAGAIEDLPGMFDDAATAVEDFARIAGEALGEVEGDVNAISLGRSPGGLKEIRLKVREAIDALRDLRNAGRADLRDVEDAVGGVVNRMEDVPPATEDVFQGDRQGDDPFAEETAPRTAPAASTAPEPTPPAEATPQPTVQVVLAPEFKIDTIDAAGMEQAVREKIGPQIVTQLRSNTDQLTVEIGRALDRYRTA